MAKKVLVSFITKPGCHLCDDARSTVEATVAVLKREGLQVELEELNMLENEKLIKKYAEDIPVVLINGKRHSFWHVDADKLEAAIRKRG